MLVWREDANMAGDGSQSSGPAFIDKASIRNSENRSPKIFLSDSDLSGISFADDSLGSVTSVDKLFAPMELEDSDLFNRFHLQQYELIQSRDAFVYHMTCRGSRFKDGIKIERIIDLPDGTKWYKPEDSAEYTLLRNNKFKEWWRKWHTDVLHDELMMPIVGNRYDTTFVVHNCNLQILAALEPWCDRIYTDCDYKEFAQSTQTDTMFDLRDKFHSIGDEMKGDVQIMFDASKLSNENFTQFIKNIPFIIQQNDSVGSFEWDIFQLHIFNLRTKDMVIPFFKNIF